jgi:hypothetical protein
MRRSVKRQIKLFRGPSQLRRLQPGGHVGGGVGFDPALNEAALVKMADGNENKNEKKHDENEGEELGGQL